MDDVEYMSMKTFRDYQPNQALLFPVDLNEWLPKDHPAHFVNEVVENLDLSAIYDSYDELRGNPPYDPRMMVRIWIYAFMKGIRSSRKIETALYEDVGFRYLSANQQPDHWTISQFRKRHHKGLGSLFEQTVKMAQRAGLVKLRHVAIDGTKIKANASKHSAMSYAYMKKEEKRLREEIERILRESDEIDRLEDMEYGDKAGWELPEELSTPEKRLAAIKKAKAELEQEAREKAARQQDERRKEAESKGKTYKPRTDPKDAEPKPRDQRNFTDPESRIMLNSDKAFIQCYNAQASVDAESHIIVAADLDNQASDSTYLPGQLKQVMRNTGKRPKEVSADAGYYSQKNLEFVQGQGIEAFIPPNKVKHSEWRTQKAIRGRIPKNATPRYLMQRKLRTKRGRARYKLRQTSVEPVFGFIKQGLGLRQFLLRGKEKVRSMWKFTCAAHNLWKLYRAGVSLSPAV